MTKLTERDFSPLETDFLRLFFTGVDTREAVYAAKPAVPMPLWAFLAGSYSRTTVTMREKLLATMRDVAGDQEHYEELLHTVVDADSAPALLVDKVEQFLSKWAVDYGHSSLKDSCVDRFAIECTSIRGAKVLERFQLGAYQEKSTRYVDFGSVEPLFECVPSGGPELRAVHDDAMALYNDVTSAAAEHYMKGLGHLDVAVASRTAKAKAFDVARYILPAYLPTALGITMPSRETEREIQYLLGHEFAEMRAIGAKLLACGTEVNPALLRHVKAKPTMLAVRKITDKAFSVFEEPSADFEDADLSLDFECYEDGAVTLTCPGPMSPLHPRWAGPAALYAEAHDVDPVASALAIQEYFNNAQDGKELLQSFWEAAFAEVGPHDEFPDALDSVQLQFRGLIDFGAYRDLQRHRRGHQQDVFTNHDYGYSIPDVLPELGTELLERYKSVMNRMSDVRAGLLSNEASYACCLGHNVMFSYTCSLRQALYVIRLRTGPAGHESYRSFTQSMARTLLSAVPELERVISVDWSENTDRSEAEQRRAAKLAQMQEGSKR